MQCRHLPAANGPAARLRQAVEIAAGQKGVAVATQDHGADLVVRLGSQRLDARRDDLRRQGVARVCGSLMVRISVVPLGDQLGRAWRTGRSCRRNAAGEALERGHPASRLFLAKQKRAIAVEAVGVEGRERDRGDAPTSVVRKSQPGRSRPVRLAHLRIVDALEVGRPGRTARAAAVREARKSSRLSVNAAKQEWCDGSAMKAAMPCCIGVLTAKKTLNWCTAERLSAAGAAA